MAEVFLDTKVFKNAHADTRALLFESSEGDPSVSIDSTLVRLQLY